MNWRECCSSESRGERVVLKQKRRKVGFKKCDCSAVGWPNEVQCPTLASEREFLEKINEEHCRTSVHLLFDVQRIWSENF